MKVLTHTVLVGQSTPKFGAIIYYFILLFNIIPCIDLQPS